MYAVGTIAIYLEHPHGGTPALFRTPEARAELTRHLWHRLGGQKDAPFRPGPLLRTRPGFTGLLLAAPTPMAYSTLVLGTGAALGENLTGPWGEVRLRRVTAGPDHHGGVRFIDMTRRPTPAPLSGPVRLVTRTPIAGKPDIIQCFRTAGERLARVLNHPELAPGSELPDWQIQDLSLRRSTDDPRLQKGSISIWSDNPYAGLILEFALITGFGKSRNLGYGHLEPALLKGDDPHAH